MAAGHIIMYERKQSAGQSKSRHGPGPARGPYVARPWTSALSGVGISLFNPQFWLVLLCLPQKDGEAELA